MSDRCDKNPRRVPCILGALNQEALLCWRNTTLTYDEISDAEAAKSRFLVVFLTETDLADAIFMNSQQNFPPALSIPYAAGSDICTNASGFFQAAHRGAKQSDAGYYTTTSRFLVKHKINTASQTASSSSAYRWEKLGFVTFHPSSKFFTMLCLDVGNDAEASIRRHFVQGKLPTLETHLFSVHTLVLKYVLESFDRAVWSWRDVVRDLETSRPHRKYATVRDFDHMHEISRHLIHSTEVLSTALSVIECMAKESDFTDRAIGDQASLVCLRELQFMTSLLKALQHRSNALEKRMENEIALAFHANAKRDTSIASRIALTSQRDGQTTKGISILGLLFLPGTYISAIFSMSFFHFAPSTNDGPEQWTVSPEFWMYWVVTIPVTALTVGMWLVLQRWHSQSADPTIGNLDVDAADASGCARKANSRSV